MKPKKPKEETQQNVEMTLLYKIIFICKIFHLNNLLFKK